MISYRDGKQVHVCDGCFRVLDKHDLVRATTGGDYCNSECASKALATRPPYRCPDCVFTGVDPCEHQDLLARPGRWAQDGQSSAAA